MQESFGGFFIGCSIPVDGEYSTILLEDENGVETNFAIMSVVLIDGKEYLVLSNVEELQSSDIMLPLSVLYVGHDEKGYYYESPSDEVCERVVKIYIENNSK